jgi:hypothetical protein
MKTQKENTINKEVDTFPVIPLDSLLEEKNPAQFLVQNEHL